MARADTHDRLAAAVARAVAAAPPMTARTADRLAVLLGPVTPPTPETTAPPAAPAASNEAA
ncbi:hypothetical protein [Kineosporia sp. R_H_3]|uniref:hypothetical protein n=1 Tax=Kineosporia sp. R_H_3 TaxID=1961848 RepID=UPI000B4A72BF|nr:hypothetical protein [Kineosporia sp. R_H_3]